VRSRTLYLFWKRQVFVRNRHPDFDALLATCHFSTGIYLLGCAGKVVYVGQSVTLPMRAIDSLGAMYHRVPDTSLPWSIALAPCPREELDERESTAIRSYAPRFNTRIPSVAKSEGRLPEIAGAAAVFQDQAGPCGAFDHARLEQQMEQALSDPHPPWKRRRTRRPTEKREPRQMLMPQPVEWNKEDAAELVKAHGVSLAEPLRFPINLCNDGSVVTRDGEYIGTWTMDENAFPAFTPLDASAPLFHHVVIGLLCLRIREWHEAETGQSIR
jgi:hypothetical protein